MEAVYHSKVSSLFAHNAARCPDVDSVPKVTSEEVFDSASSDAATFGRNGHDSR